MQQYLDLLNKIITTGKRKPNRTGIDTISISGYMFEHEMLTGFPILTTKKVGIKNVSKELEFFIRGLHLKNWLQNVGCHIWDEWCPPSLIPYSNDPETKEKMKNENELGRIYGVQWRQWRGVKIDSAGNLKLVLIDQLKNAIETLKKDPCNRRIIVSAWNPVDMDDMALPPCHYGFQFLSDGHTLDLLWNQRSVDTPLGLPYNISSYAILLELVARTVGMVPGKLIGFLADVHIYVNQMEGVEEQLSRTPKALPLCTTSCTDVLDWNWDDFSLIGYDPCDPIHFEIAV